MKEVLMVGLFSMMVSMFEMWLWTTNSMTIIFIIHTLIIVSLFYIAGGKDEK